VNDETIPCWIYRSPRKQEMYLYLPVEDDFSSIPHELLSRFGSPAKVMHLTLRPELKLAREDVHKVMTNLRGQGYHLQMPPKLQVKLYHGE
jgi:uncharacterized protein YcgL (UPF0745 family)